MWLLSFWLQLMDLLGFLCKVLLFFPKKSLSSLWIHLSRKPSLGKESALDHLEASVFPDAAVVPQTLRIKLSVVLSKALIYLVLPCLLATLSLAFPSLITLPLIFPRSHQSLLISFPPRSHFCLSNTSPTVFSFALCLFLSSSTLFSSPELYLIQGSVPATILTSSLDTVVALCLSAALLSLATFRHGDNYSKLWRKQKTLMTPRMWPHSQFTLRLY